MFRKNCPKNIYLSEALFIFLLQIPQFLDNYLIFRFIFSWHTVADIVNHYFSEIDSRLEFSVLNINISTYFKLVTYFLLF